MTERRPNDHLPIPRPTHAEILRTLGTDKEMSCHEINVALGRRPWNQSATYVTVQDMLASGQLTRRQVRRQGGPTFLYKFADRTGHPQAGRDYTLEYKLPGQVKRVITMTFVTYDPVTQVYHFNNEAGMRAIRREYIISMEPRP